MITSPELLIQRSYSRFLATHNEGKDPTRAEEWLSCWELAMSPGLHLPEVIQSDQNTMGRKGLISSYNCESIVERSQGRTCQEPGGRNWIRAYEGTSFLQRLRTSWPGMAPYAVDWGLVVVNNQLRKSLRDMSTNNPTEETLQLTSSRWL